MQVEKTIPKRNVKIEESAMAVVLCKGKLLTTVELIYGKETLSLPKGHREENETLIDTAIRECFEETNVILTEENLVRELPPYAYEFTSPSNQLIRKTIAPFLFETESEGTPLPKEKRMISVQWMHPDEFIKNCRYENVIEVVKQLLI